MPLLDENPPGMKSLSREGGASVGEIRGEITSGSGTLGIAWDGTLARVLLK